MLDGKDDGDEEAERNGEGGWIKDIHDILNVLYEEMIAYSYYKFWCAEFECLRILLKTVRGGRFLQG